MWAKAESMGNFLQLAMAEAGAPQVHHPDGRSPPGAAPGPLLFAFAKKRVRLKQDFAARQDGRLRLEAEVRQRPLYGGTVPGRKSKESAHAARGR